MSKPELRRLFDITDSGSKNTVPKKKSDTSKPSKQKTDDQKPKRGRPKAVPLQKQQPEPKPKKKKQETENSDTEWKDFNTSKPEPHIPCNFKVETGKKVHMFRGYIEQIGITCTDDPYAMTFLRKKYGNLYYSEISGCTIEDCPSGFPRCESCKKRKNK